MPPAVAALALIKTLQTVSSSLPRDPNSTLFSFWMQLNFHATRRTPHGASRLVHAISAWSAKNPTCSVSAVLGIRGSIWSHRRTTIVHEMSTPPPTTPALPSCPPCLTAHTKSPSPPYVPLCSCRTHNISLLRAPKPIPMLIPSHLFPQRLSSCECIKSFPILIPSYMFPKRVSSCQGINSFPILIPTYLSPKRVSSCEGINFLF